MKNAQKRKLGDAHATPKKYPRGTRVKAWGCPRGTPSSSAKIRSPFKTPYFYCFMHYAFFLERQLFLLSVFFCFGCGNKWLDHIMFLERDLLRFSLPRTLGFSHLSFNKCSLFQLLHLAFDFCLDFIQILLYLCMKVYLDHWSMLVFLKRVVSKRFEWCWKKKVTCKKVVQKGACVDCGLGLCMSCLMSF
jgi:hypothetical protein